MRSETRPSFDQSLWFDRNFGAKDVFVGLPLIERPPFAVIDRETLGLVQANDLHAAVDRTTTRLGSATLFESLVLPPTDPKLIKAKQAGVAELSNNAILRDALTKYLGSVKEREDMMLGFLDEGISPMGPFDPTFYRRYKKIRKAFRKTISSADAIPPTESQYATDLVEQIKESESSLSTRLMRGPFFRTQNGLKSKEDIDIFTPRFKFRPRRITGGTLALSLPSIAENLGINLVSGKPGSISLPEMAFMMSTMFAFIYPAIMKAPIDSETAMNRLRETSLSDPTFLEMLHSVGKLDELMSFSMLMEANPDITVMPTITDDPMHHFSATDLRNPVLAKDNPDFVPNDVDLTNAKITFVTGPNSGGKTTYCKTILQNQLMGQIGGPVFATSATINIADQLAYQAPHFDALQDSEGRFGTELARTRDIFLGTTPKSLVVLDELAEGTTLEEKMEQSVDVLEGFYAIGNNTILVTHNHALVDKFAEGGLGQFLQVEFIDQEPTHRMIQGISRDSHAQQVAKKIGFSKADIQTHLRQKGYLPPEPEE